MAIETAKDAAIGVIRDPLTLYTEQSGMMFLPPIMSLESHPGEVWNMFPLFSSVFLSFDKIVLIFRYLKLFISLIIYFRHIVSL